VNDLVIARYKEDISWIDDNNLTDKFNVIVYNKFHNEPITLPNAAGRESHTYLWHIVSNYDTLADRTVFCQGDPFEHSPNFLNLIGKVNSADKLGYFPMSQARPEEGLLRTDGVIPPLGDGTLHCNILGQPNHPFLNMEEQFFNIFGRNAVVPNPIVFFPGAVFCCSKETIHNRSLDFYKKCYELSTNAEWTDNIVHDKLPPGGNICCAYFFERFWSYIFNYHKIDYVDI